MPMTISTWAAGIAQGLDQLGLDARGLFRRAGLDLSALRSQAVRMPTSDLSRLWDVVIATTGWPHAGLEVAGHIRMSTLQALGTALLNSSSPADAGRRIERYFPLLTDAMSCRISEQGPSVRIRLPAPAQGRELADADVDLVLALVLKFLRELTQGAFQPTGVELVRARPADPDRYRRHFGCPIRFGRPENVIRCTTAAWHTPLTDFDPELSEVSDDLIEAYLEHLEVDPVATLVRAEIVKLLPLGEPDLAQVAGALHTSSRSLQRRLDEALTSYSGMIRSVRQELANRYLGDPAYSLKDVAYLLGFSDQANFSRAFKSWYGTPPGLYRRQLRHRRLAVPL